MPTWLYLLLACCGVIAVFGLLIQRRPFIGGFGLAVMVLCIVAVAWLGVGRGAHSAFWPRCVRRHAPHIPPVPAPPDVAFAEQRLAEMAEDGHPVVVPVIVENKVVAESRQKAAKAAEEAYREALEAVRQSSRGLITPDDSGSIIFSDQTDGPPLTIELEDENGSWSMVLKERAPQRRLPRRDTWLGSVVPSLLIAGAIAVFLYIGYILLDAGTRGHFTWSLRIVSVLAFGVLLVTLAALRLGL